jgi:hypothetical protein
LTPTALDFKAPGTLFQFGKIGSQEGSINISFSGSENNAFMKLGADGKSLSNMTIRNDTLLIQSGKTNNKNPTIELKEGSLKLRCGTVVTNPEILITDTEVKIKVGADATGSSFVMTKDSIELTVGIGPAQSALKISSTGVEIKSGEATSTKWSPKSIDMAAAETKMKLDLTETQQNTIRLKQNAAFKAEIKAALLMLKGDPALKLDAILKSL